MSLDFFDRLAGAAVHSTGETTGETTGVIKPPAVSRFEPASEYATGDDVDFFEEIANDDPFGEGTSSATVNRPTPLPLEQPQINQSPIRETPDLTEGLREVTIQKETQPPGAAADRGVVGRPFQPQIVPSAAPGDLPASPLRPPAEHAADRGSREDRFPSDQEVWAARTIFVERSTSNRSDTASAALVKRRTSAPAQPQEDSETTGMSPTPTPVREPQKPSPQAPLIRPRLTPLVPAAAEEKAFEEKGVETMPTIEISIGRVELRPEPPAQPAAATPPSRFKPSLSLDDYLAERGGGSR